MSVHGFRSTGGRYRVSADALYSETRELECVHTVLYSRVQYIIYKYLYMPPAPVGSQRPLLVGRSVIARYCLATPWKAA